MTVGWCGAAISILLLLHSPDPVFSKKKIIKLIVPHKIKYLHHTHVLLVTPKKKPSHKAKEIINDDEQSYHHYVHDGRSKGKPQVHYVLPYIAQPKENIKGYKNYRSPHHHEDDEELDSYLIDDYHSRRLPEASDVMLNVLPPNKNPTAHRGLRIPYKEEPPSMMVRNKPRYIYKEPIMTSLRKPHYSFESPPPEEMVMPSMTYHTLPENFDSDYMAQLSAMDPGTLTPEEGGWGSEQFSMPEKTSAQNYYKGGYYEPSSARYNN